MDRPEREPLPAILEAIDGVIGDASDSGDLLQALAECKNELLRMKNDFYSTVSRLSQSAGARCTREVNAVAQLFAAYEGILETAGTYVQGFDKGILVHARAALEEVIEKLNVEFARFREAMLVALGPSSHGGINLLLACVEKIPPGLSTPEELRGAVELQKIFTAAILEQARAVPPTSLSEAYRVFNEEYLRILEEFSGRISAGEGENLDAFRLSLEQLGESHRYVDIDYMAKHFTAEPTAIPLANLLLNCARHCGDGKINKDIMRHILKDFRDLILNLELGGQEVNAAKALSPVIEEEGRALIEALHGIRTALDSYEDLLSQGEFGRLPEIEAGLISATESFESALVLMKEFSDHEGMIPCMKCGAFNAQGDTKCFSCSMILPSLLTEKLPALDIREEGPMPLLNGDTRMTTNIFKVFDASDALLEGVICAPEFLSIVDELDSLVKKGAASTRPAPGGFSRQEGGAAQEMSGRLSGAHALYGAAISDFIRGISLFREFARNPVAGLRDKAKEAAWEGMAKLQKMQTLLFPLIQPDSEKEHADL